MRLWRSDLQQMRDGRQRQVLLRLELVVMRVVWVKMRLRWVLERHRRRHQEG